MPTISEPLIIVSNTCRAKNIQSPWHDCIDNTLKPVQAAFAYCADVVELAVRLIIGDIIAVFLDWRPEYQTNRPGVNNQQSFEYLKQPDLGYRFTRARTLHLLKIRY